MSNDKSEDTNSPSEDEVGFRKPPKQHQFRKGQSGNPKGRPKGSKNRQSLRAPDAPLLGSDEPTRKLILEESYRLVRVRDGERIIEMPVNQAILRALQQKALKGSRLAQRDLTLMIRQVEADQKSEQFEGFKAAVEYRDDCLGEIARCKAKNEDPPEMIPHPDDIIIVPRRGTFAVLGPMTPEEKLELEQTLKHRDHLQMVTTDTSKRYLRAKDEERKTGLLDIWHDLQRNFDAINDFVGPRYQAELENRSFADGATRPGDVARENGFGV